MTDNQTKLELLGQFILEASERRDALTIDDKLRENHIVWIESVRKRLTRAFGDTEIVWSFNNPDYTGTFESYDDSSDALAAAKEEYERDIGYFRSIRLKLRA